MAYLDGDLLQAIDGKIRASEVVKANFAGLFASDNALGDGNQHLILCYVLDRYVKMRGCWFVKFIKGSQEKSGGEIKAENAPTRAKVANVHVKSKAVAEEKELWDSAKQQVLDFKNDKEEHGKSTVESDSSNASMV